MKKSISLLILGFILLSVNKNITRLTISDNEFKYSFGVSQSKLKRHDLRKRYYWYKSQKLHSTIGSSNGKLLEGDFIRSYRSDEIAERGSFKNGLKNGKWVKWFENGTVKSISFWYNGVQVKKYVEFTDQGVLKTQGKYSNGRKHGKWIDYAKGDTLEYRKGEIKLPKEKKEKLDTLNATDEKEKKFRIKGLFKKDSLKQKEKDTTPFFKRLFKGNEDKVKEKKKKEKKSKTKKDGKS